MLFPLLYGNTNFDMPIKKKHYCSLNWNSSQKLFFFFFGSLEQEPVKNLTKQDTVVIKAN